MKLALKGKQKLDHLVEDPSSHEDARFKMWDVEDTIIMTWLLNLMQLNISRNFMLLESSKEIWEMVRKTYSKVQDASVIYQIKTRMASTKQDNLTVTE